MHTPAYLGIDIGSISTKGVILDAENRILAESYLWTEGNPIEAAKRLLSDLQEKTPDSTSVLGVGTTGSARKLIGVMLGASVVKNEITAHAVGARSRCPDVRTILEIGGQDSKLILLQNGVVTDYAMNTLCAAGTGAFLSAQAKRLGIPLEEIGGIALRAKNPVKIAARCTVFAESDLIHKAQAGFQKEDLIAGLCSAVVSNYLNNVGKGKKIWPPVVFQGGVSKNEGVVRAFERAVGFPVEVCESAHLMGAIGAAILSKSTPCRRKFQFEAVPMDFMTSSRECDGCANHCEVVSCYGNGILLDSWGNRCEKGTPSAAAFQNHRKERL